MQSTTSPVSWGWLYFFLSFFFPAAVECVFVFQSVRCEGGEGDPTLPLTICSLGRVEKKNLRQKAMYVFVCVCVVFNLSHLQLALS